MREPRISVSRSIFALIDEPTACKFAAPADPLL
jgi:hypothetical protein